MTEQFSDPVSIAAAYEIARSPTNPAYLYNGKDLEAEQKKKSQDQDRADYEDGNCFFLNAANEESHEFEEDDAENRLARCRERNREHARRTRIRKKAQLRALETKVKGLQAESRVLKQRIEDCSIASILVGLSGGGATQEVQSSVEGLIDNFENTLTQPKLSIVAVGKRKRFVTGQSLNPPQQSKLNINGHVVLIGGDNTHINWKSGLYCDENGVQHQLTQDQLERLRRERNRMHAKMTRDRKKGFIAAAERTIEQLQADNELMRHTLSKVAEHHFGKSNPGSPVNSPLFTALDTNPNVTPASCDKNITSGASFLEEDAPSELVLLRNSRTTLST